MIVVATTDFELYHEVVTELRARGVTFTTIEPGESVPEQADGVITSEAESLDVAEDVPVINADPDHSREAVENLLALLRSEEGRLVVGIDPGDMPGIAILAGEVVIAAFQVPPDRVSEVLERELATATDPLVRIGDGARMIGSQIVDDIEEVPVELVDETGTTPYLGSGARGMGDVLAAVNIARIEGERVDSIDIEPTAGEIQRIQTRSREASDTNRTIDEQLARAVALGDLSISEALEEHRSEDN